MNNETINMRFFKIFSTALLCAIFAPAFLMAQKITTEEYIQIYKDIAIREMKRSGIPASITLAQGILESGSGNSTLATKANNHFGIKCHDWTGRSVRHDDDKRNECFRKYKDADESYIDHSDFLMKSPRYRFLFEYEITDYKSWAKGLKKAGYATSRTYDDLLIKIIERYELYQYDTEKGRKKRTPSEIPTEIAIEEEIKTNNHVKYVYAGQNERLLEIANEYDKFESELRRYNDFEEGVELSENDIVYLQPKRNKAAAGLNWHVAREGESLHDISQLYAVKMDKLQKRNDLNGTEIAPGDTIWLRGNNSFDLWPFNTTKNKPKKPLIKEPKTQKQEKGKEEEKPAETKEEETEFYFEMPE